jgi:GT2 family glycosyltransferase
MGPPELTLGIVSYNTRDLTVRCVDAALAAVHGLPALVSIADNGSSDGTPETLRTTYSQAVCLAFPDNPGYGGALNRIFTRYPARFLLAMNADVFLEKDTVTRLQALLESHPECGLVGPSFTGRDGEPQPSCRRFPSMGFAMGELFALHGIFPGNPWNRRGYYAGHDLTSHQWVEAVSGACMLIRGEAFRRVGGFDEGFRMYFEETDLCWRLRAAGFSTGFCPQARAVHWHGASTIQTSVRQVEYYLSYVRFFRKHHGRGPARALAAAIAVSTLARMLVLPLKYPPLSRRQIRLLRPKLAACRRLLADLPRWATAGAETQVPQ